MTNCIEYMEGEGPTSLTINFPSNRMVRQFDRSFLDNLQFFKNRNNNVYLISRKREKNYANNTTIPTSLPQFSHNNTDNTSNIWTNSNGSTNMGSFSARDKYTSAPSYE